MEQDKSEGDKQAAINRAQGEATAGFVGTAMAVLDKTRQAQADAGKHAK